jgi:hypothetical protein
MTEHKKCDCACGRDAVTKFGRLNLCEECAGEILDSNGPFPKPRLRDLIDAPDCVECGERAGVTKYNKKWYCRDCFDFLRELEFPGDEEL